MFTPSVGGCPQKQPGGEVQKQPASSLNPLSSVFVLPLLVLGMEYTLLLVSSFKAIADFPCSWLSAKGE